MRLAPVLVLGVGLLLAAAALGGCGDADDEPAAPRTASTPSAEIALKVVSDNGAGSRRTGELTCGEGAPRASGELYDGQDAARLCTLARSIRELLTTQPPKDRMCTQIYGGPETGHVTGTIDGTPVDRRFSRTNGCEVDDFSRAAGLLQP